MQASLKKFKCWYLINKTAGNTNIEQGIIYYL